MSIKTFGVSLLAISVVALGILFSKSLGLWETESTKTPATIATGEFEGEPNPEDIRGSFSFGDIENAFHIDSQLLAQAFSIETSAPQDILLKDLELIFGENEAVISSGYELGTGAVKLFVSLYTGLPYVSTEDALPDSAVLVLQEEDKWTEEMAMTLEGKIIMLEGTSYEASTAVSEEAESEEEHEEEIGIKGKTTVQDVINWGIPKEEIESVMGIEVDNANMVIRDICTAEGIDFGTVKETLNEALLQ